MEVMAMKVMLTAVCCFLVLCMPAFDAGAILVALSEQDTREAIEKGGERGNHVAAYVKQHYHFGGDEKAFRENGIIRTKWSKLMVLAGLLAAKGEGPHPPDVARILNSTELQIDIHAYGSRIDFANDYRAHILQGGRRIEPTTIGIDHPLYLPDAGNECFPLYHATIRSYFPYDKISPAEKVEIVLTKDKTTVSFEVNFADYK
jgi:hypothetical protein